MRDPFDLSGHQIYTLHFAADSMQALGEDPYADLKRACARRLRDIASMLSKQNFYTLKPGSRKLQTIINYITEVREDLKRCEEELIGGEYVLTIRMVREQLKDIISLLYTAGSRTEENEFSVKKERFTEFLDCCDNLEHAATLLMH